MSGFPTIHFGQAESSPFSPREIEKLMGSEYERSRRYGHALTLLCVEIDRLESLHDLYGVESEQRIRRSVATLLRSSTRASDVLGTTHGQRLLILLPHTGGEGARAVARRLLVGCRALEFRGEGRTLRASLSIGMAQRGDEDGLARLVERAEEALRQALAGGGDRFVEYEPRPGVEAAPLSAPPSVTRAPVPAGGRSPSPPPLPAVHELSGTTLEERVREILRIAGGDELASGLEREVLAVLRQVVGEAGRPRTSRAEVRAERERLEERVALLKRLVDASEEELARLVREKSVDPGVASIYRTVQGLDPTAEDFRRKKELLAVIYRANLELLRQLEEEG